MAITLNHEYNLVEFIFNKGDSYISVKNMSQSIYVKNVLNIIHFFSLRFFVKYDLVMKFPKL